MLSSSSDDSSLYYELVQDDGYFNDNNELKNFPNRKHYTQFNMNRNYPYNREYGDDADGKHKINRKSHFHSLNEDSQKDDFMSRQKHVEQLYAEQPFYFRPRREQLNWRVLRSINVSEIIDDLDLDALEMVLHNITFSDIGLEDMRYFTEGQFIKVFRLAQLIIEYLLYVQGCLARKQEATEGDIRDLISELEKCRGIASKYHSDNSRLKKDTKRMKKHLIAYEAVFGVSPDKAKRMFKSMADKNGSIPEEMPTQQSSKTKSDPEIENLKQELSSEREKLLRMQRQLQDQMTEYKTHASTQDANSQAEINHLNKQVDQLHRALEQQKTDFQREYEIKDEKYENSKQRMEEKMQRALDSQSQQLKNTTIENDNLKNKISRLESLLRKQGSQLRKEQAQRKQFEKRQYEFELSQKQKEKQRQKEKPKRLLTIQTSTSESSIAPQAKEIKPKTPKEEEEEIDSCFGEEGEEEGDALENEYSDRFKSMNLRPRRFLPVLN
eukprot:gb/GECH01009462.1/.p1 GENE.gb/GECH01009462.1/~~gb/GECH01009462.1/.p1  ORF type:complete len:496 (+),score=156.27 gb/GECH01009462.1/:1-1488(+)